MSTYCYVYNEDQYTGCSWYKELSIILFSNRDKAVAIAVHFSSPSLLNPLNNIFICPFEGTSKNLSNVLKVEDVDGGRWGRVDRERSDMVGIEIDDR